MESMDEDTPQIFGLWLRLGGIVFIRILTNRAIIMGFYQKDRNWAF
jgi:hypothetical protein